MYYLQNTWFLRLYYTKNIKDAWDKIGLRGWLALWCFAQWGRKVGQVFRQTIRQGQDASRGKLAIKQRAAGRPVERCIGKSPCFSGAFDGPLRSKGIGCLLIFRGAGHVPGPFGRGLNLQKVLCARVAARPRCRRIPAGRREQHGSRGNAVCHRPVQGG